MTKTTFTIKRLLAWTGFVFTFCISLSASANNVAPDCSTAYADPNSLWPPNHSMQSISISGVTDADGDVPAINVQCIYQDEPLDSNGDGNTEPDADGINTDTAQVRRERQGGGNGRVYHIFFKATDPMGAACFGEVTASVNHDKKTAAVDDGALYESVPSGLPCTASPNTAPVVEDISDETAEDTILAITLIGSDADSDPLTYTLQSLPQNGSVSLNNDTVTYTPAANFNGSDSFTYQANDGEFDSNIGTVTINITPVNDAPIANGQSVYTSEDTAVAITLTGSDIENSALSYQLLTTPQNGMLTGTAPNLTYTPNANYNGNDSITFSVNDGELNSNIATVDILVDIVNDAPVADDQSLLTDEDTILVITLSGSDVESSSLSYQVQTQPTNGVLTGTGANLVYTPNENFNGSDSFTFIANDGELDSNVATVSINVQPVNDKPVAEDGQGPLSTNEDTAINIVLSGSDIENDPITYQIQTQPQHGVLSGTLPNVVYTPNLNFNGDDSFTFVTNDGELDSNAASIDIIVNPVNDAPTANTQNLSIDEDTDLNIVLTGSDIEGSALTFEIQTQPANGVLTGTLQDFIYTPNQNFNGNDSFTFYVNDGELSSAVASVSIDVNPVNDAPTANSDSGTTAEDTALDITLSGSDIENDPLTYQIQIQPTNGILTGTGENLVYTPNENYHGPDSFTFIVNDGELDSAPATFDITVTPVNDKPTASVQPLTVLEDTSGLVEISANDIEGDALTLQILTAPSFGALVGDYPNLTYIPSENYTGNDSFTFVANDGELDSDLVTANITVLPVNDAPTTNSDSGATAEDTALAIVLTGSDIENDPLTFQVQTQPSNGSLSGTAPNLTFTPNENFNGSDSFTFIANDGELNSNVATFSITVTPVNDAPTANSDSGTTAEDTALPIVLAGGDIENDPLTFQVQAQPANGVLTGTGENLVYTPNENFNGSDSFTFVSNDGELGSNVATFSITVTPVNDAPTANADSGTTAEDTALAITLTGSDIENDPLTFQVQAQPANGVLTGTGENLVYTPNENFNGSDSFAFIANDGALDSNVATFSITVTPVNDAPTANSESGTTAEDSTLAITLNGSDIENDPLIFQVQTQPANGVLSGVSPNLTYTPNANFDGSDSFAFVSNDGELNSNVATFNITVTPVNDAPTADSDSGATAEDTALSIVLLGSDIESDPLTFQIQTQPSNGVLSGVAPNLTYTPNENFNGSDSFTFIANDGALDSNIATFSITVTPVNDVPTVSDQSATVLEDGSIQITLSGDDVDGDSLNFIIQDGPVNGVLSGAAPNLVYTPNADFSDNDSFTFVASDGTATSAAATVSISVTPVNDAPIADYQAVDTNEDVAVSILLTGSDVENDPLSFSIVNQPANGVLTGVVPNLVYTPNPDYFGSDTFTFNVNDGLLDSALATVTINVVEINDSPEINSIAITEATSGEPYAYMVMAIDPDGDALTFSLTSNVADMSIDPSSGIITWVPDNSQVGDHNVTVRATDPGLLFAEQSFVITVESGNLPPEFTSQAITDWVSGSLYIYQASATDPEGESVTYTLDSGPAGMVIDENSGVVQWTPADTEVGTYSIQISAADASGVASTQMFDLTIALGTPNTAPQITSEPVTQAARFVAYEYDVDASDDEGHAFSFSLAHGPFGMSIDEQTGLIQWTPSAEQQGAFSVTVRVTDELNASSEQNFTVIVAAPNHQGNDFWVMFNDAPDGSSYRKIYLFIASQFDANGMVTIPNLGLQFPFSVLAGQSTTVDLSDYRPELLTEFGGEALGKNNGVQVTSDQLISVYAMHQVRSSSDGTLVLPTRVLDTHYMALTHGSGFWDIDIPYTPYSAFPSGQIGVLATEDNTSITFTFPEATEIFDSTISIPAGGQYSVQLNRGSTFGFTFMDIYGGSGVTIESSDPIAVFSGEYCGNIPLKNTQACDHLVEQLPGVKYWSDEYMAYPLATRYLGDTFRAVMAFDNTELRVNGEIVSVLNKGDWWQDTMEAPAVFSANHPFLMAQFSNGSGYDYLIDYNSSVDPFMMLLPAKSQYLNHYILTTPIQNFAGENYINVIIPADAVNSLRLNGQFVDTGLFTAIPNTEYMGAQLQVETGSHELVADKPFGASIYGFDYYDSYGYNGGQLLTQSSSQTQLSLTPISQTPTLGDEACLTASMVDDGVPVSNARVDFTITGGNARIDHRFTNGSGVAEYCYHALSLGFDLVTAQFGDLSDSAQVDWQSIPSNDSIPRILTQQLNDAAVGEAYSQIVAAAVGDNAGLTFRLESELSGISIDGSGVMQMLPTTEQIGSHQVDVWVDSDSGTSANRSFTLQVSQRNQPPVITQDIEEMVLEFNYQTGRRIEASDPEADTVIMRIVNGPAAFSLTNDLIDIPVGTSSTLDPIDLVVLEPNTDLLGDHQVTIEMRDFRGAVSQHTFNFTLIADRPPEFQDDLSATIVSGHRHFHWLYAIDPERRGDVDFTIDVAPEGLEYHRQTHGLDYIEWTPRHDQVGEYELTITATDNGGLSTTETFTLTVTPNHDPVFTKEPVTTAMEGHNYRYDVGMTDPDGDQVWSYMQILEGPEEMWAYNKTSLRWVPDHDDVGEVDVVLYIQDGVGGEATQSFTIQVAPNSHPYFTSTPWPYAGVGRGYVYQASANDPDGDSVWARFIADTPLPGMTFTSRGRLTWTPTIDDIGSHTITLGVYDGAGGIGEQTFTLVVGDDVFKIIGLEHDNPALVGQPYSNKVLVHSPGISITDYTLLSGPPGLTVDRWGTLSWMPTVDQVGTHNIEVEVLNYNGQTTSAILQIRVVADNTAPVIDQSSLNTSAYVDHPYSYQVVASDPDNDPLSYRFLYAPPGMTISTTGLIQWTPTIDQVGNNLIHVLVSDGIDETALEYVIAVTENAGPVVDTDALPRIMVVDRFVEIPFPATDPDGGLLFFNLVSGPEGFTITPDGLMSWQPTQTGAYNVEVEITDGITTVNQSWVIDVIPEDALGAEVNITPATVNLNDTVLIDIDLINAFGSITVDANVNGVPLTLDTNYQASVVADTAGVQTITVSVTDDFNSITETVEFFVIDPSDTTDPVVSISSPEQNAEVTAPIDIVGTVSDDNLVSYQVLLTDPEGNILKEIGNGTDSVTDAILASLDPTLLKNGLYQVAVMATDIGGNQTQEGLVVLVAGNMKLGHFSITFQDMMIPVAGIPIQILRTYDSRERLDDQDFGYGWSIDFKDALVQESRIPGLGWDTVSYQTGPLPTDLDYCIEPLGQPPLVTIFLPGEEVEVFEVEASPRCMTLVAEFPVQLSFKPVGNSTSTLEVKNSISLRERNDNLVNDLTGELEPHNPDEYVLTTRDGTIIELDQNFGMTKITDRNGHYVEFTEDSITHSDGKSIQINRNADGNIEKIIDPKQNEVSYTYNTLGELTHVINQVNEVTEFTYYDEHFLKDIIDDRQIRVSKSYYYDDGRLKAVENADGKLIDISYDISGRQQTVVGLSGKTTVYTYNELGLVIQELVVDDNLLTTYEYDEWGNEKYVDFNNGQLIIERLYDDRGDLLKEWTNGVLTSDVGYNDDGNITHETNEFGETTTYEYLNGDLIKTILHGGAEVSYEYDNGFMKKKIDVNGNESIYTKDANGNLYTVEDAEGGTRVFNYDGNNNIDSMTFSRTIDGVLVDETFHNSFDGRNRISSITYPGGRIVSRGYNVNGELNELVGNDGNRISMTITPTGNPDVITLHNGKTLQEQYDDNGNLTHDIDENGYLTEHMFDAQGRNYKTIHPDLTYIETRYDNKGREWQIRDENGNWITKEYYPNNRLRKEINARGDETNYDYYDNGYLKSITNGNGHVTTFEYDNRGFKSKEIYHDSTFVEFEYDNRGNIVKQWDENRHLTQFVYNKVGRLIQVIDANNKVTEYAYDEVGNIVQIKDAMQRITKWSYYSENRVKTRTLPGLQQESFTYLPEGKINTYTDFNGNTSTYTYYPDGYAKGKVQRISYDDGTFTEFSYVDDDSQMTITTESGGNVYEYDIRGRITRVTDEFNQAVSYTYTDMGQVKMIATPFGSTTYEYNAANWLEKVVDVTGETIYTYDGVGNIKSITYPMGVLVEYDYDVRDRLTDIRFYNGAQLFQSYVYTYYDNGQRESVIENSGRIVVYEYDELDRLRFERITDPITVNQIIQHQYNAVGNRTKQIIDGVSTDYGYDENDRLIMVNADSLIYDDNGNLVSQIKNGEIVDYQYNGKNQLIGIDQPGISLSFGYNGKGTRSSKTVNGVTTRYLIDSNSEHAQILANLDSGNQLLSQYQYGHMRLYQETQNGREYFQANAHGSVTGLWDSNAQQTASYLYSGYGELINSSGNDTQFGYSGELMDSETGLQYLRARYYDPSLGRFSRMDAWLGNRQQPITLNKYLYGNGDPINNIDPSGNISMIEVMSAQKIQRLLNKITKVGANEARKCVRAAAKFLRGVAVSLGSEAKFKKEIKGTRMCGAAAWQVGFFATHHSGVLSNEFVASKLVPSWGGNIENGFTNFKNNINLAMMGVKKNPTGHDWHHVVEKKQPGFNTNAINSVANLVPTPVLAHKRITRYFARRDSTAFTNGTTLRSWLTRNRKTYRYQWKLGMKAWAASYGSLERIMPRYDPANDPNMPNW